MVVDLVGLRMDACPTRKIVGREDRKVGLQGVAVHQGIIRIRGQGASSPAPTVLSAAACTYPSVKEGKKSK